jgi:uncharacterized protein (TIGR02246 family)
MFTFIRLTFIFLALNFTCQNCHASQVPLSNRSSTMSIQEQIKLTNQKWMDAVKQGDKKMLATLYTVDSIIVPPHSDLVHGKAEIEALIKGFVDSQMQITLQTINVEQYQDMAYEVGRAIVANSAGEVVENSHYLVIWKNVNGVWKMHRDIWNQTQILPQPELSLDRYHRGKESAKRTN